MDKLDPTSLSTTPFPRPVSFLSKHTLAPAWGSQEKKKKNLLLGLPWFSALLLGESGGKEGRARGTRDVPYTDIPGSAGAVGEPCPLFPEAGHYRQEAAPCSVLATTTRPGWPGAEPLQCSSSAGRTVA